ncbi:TonB-dependent receptor [Chelatococcus sp. SYSU_G07232]|uniref:TonB-dependent receptor n=2 Tax=Chelatococcus albus TaxID=3047466 RepID=A0ABT7ANX4_9HYPH|nr:TonB-dependent receptor [Chelatococcus sp. SYSU_G07232]
MLDPLVIAAPRVMPNTARERLEALPGGVALVTAEDMPSTGNLTLSKALASVPGVVVQDFFGGNDQPRVQIRGSGLQQNPVERGILVLQNGLPINRADGSYVVGFADPLLAEAIEVYRGYTANRLGATVLGGALNFVSPTGSASPGARFTASGGSFGQAGVSGQAGFRADRFDGLFQFDASRRDGYRVYNQSERVSVGGNVGVDLSETVKTRFFAGYMNLGFDVPGPLTKSAMEADPRQVSSGPLVTPAGAINPGPNVVRDRPRREASQFLIGSRTTATFDQHLFDVAFGYTYTDDTFRFPISSGVRMTRGGDFAGVARYAYKPDDASVLPLFETTAQYAVGSADRENYLNQSGTTVAKFGESRLDATTLSLNAGFNIPLLQTVTLSPAIAYSYATRDNTDTYDRPTRPTIAYNPANPSMLLPGGAVPATSTGYAKSYSGWTPSLGLAYRPDGGQTFFAALSRSFEPPTHDDLLATVNGTPNSSPGRPNPANPALRAPAFTTPALKAQEATTIEAGWRGRSERVSWDAVAYYSWIDNELLSLRDATGAPLGAINADRTTHLGVELGLGAQLTDRIAGRLAYTYQDFRFNDDPVRGDNRLAGAPRHVVQATLQYRPFDSWAIQAALRWSPEKTPVDNMNSLFADPYAVVDIRTEYRISDRLTVFGEITNLFNETYASSTLIVDQARPDQAAFLPGDGRAFYAGLKATF